MNFILYSFRRYHQLTKERVANKMQLSLRQYNLLESGKLKIDVKLAQQFSVIYKAPKYVFIMLQSNAAVQVVFNHNHFENSNGFVQHLQTGTKTSAEPIQIHKLI